MRLHTHLRRLFTEMLESEVYDFRAIDIEMYEIVGYIFDPKSKSFRLQITDSDNYFKLELAINEDAAMLIGYEGPNGGGWGYAGEQMVVIKGMLLEEEKKYADTPPHITHRIKRMYNSLKYHHNKLV